VRTAKSQGIRPGRASILPPCSTSVPFPPKSMPRSALPILQTVRTYLSKRTILVNVCSITRVMRRSVSRTPNTMLLLILVHHMLLRLREV
jgi:ABC-type arginine transport system permease subunit